jgi:hypothetical protein
MPPVAKPKPMKTLVRRSIDNTTKSSKEMKRSVNGIWEKAHKSKLYTTKLNPAEKKKREVLAEEKGEEPNYEGRAQRLIGGAAYKILLSGAGAYASTVIRQAAYNTRSIKVIEEREYGPKDPATQKRKSKRVVVYEPESDKAPILPTFTSGARNLFEQFICAYAQEGAMNAVNVKRALQTTKENANGDVEHTGLKRLNGPLMRIGFDAADKNVFGATTPSSAATFVLPKLPMVQEFDKATGKMIWVEAEDEEYVVDADELKAAMEEEEMEAETEAVGDEAEAEEAEAVEAPTEEEEEEEEEEAE